MATADAQEPRKLGEAEVEAERIGVDRLAETRVAQARRPVVPLPPRRTRRWLSWLLFIIVIASVIYGWIASQADPLKLYEKRDDFARILGQVLRADFLDQQQQIFVAQFTSPGQSDYATQINQKISADLDSVLQTGQQIQAAIKAGTFKADSDQMTSIQGFVRDASDVQIVLQGNTDPNATVSAAQPGKPQLTLSPLQGTPGDKITVKGSNFAANTKVDLSWIGGQQAELPLVRIDPTAPVSVQTDSNGSFTTSFITPAAESGRLFNSNRIKATALVTLFAPSDSLKNTWGSILVTVFQSFLASIIAIFVSVPLAFLAARNIMPNKPLGNAVFFVVRTFLNIMRSIEVLIIAVIFAAAVGVGPFAGLLALTVHSIASLAKLYSEAIEGIDPGPSEAIRTTGANPIQVARFAIVPQVIPAFISFTLYRWDVNVRMATIVGFVGGGGVGFLLNSYAGNLQWAQAGTVIWAIALVVIMLDFASSKIRQALV